MHPSVEMDRLTPIQFRSEPLHTRRPIMTEPVFDGQQRTDLAAWNVALVDRHPSIVLLRDGDSISRMIEGEVSRDLAAGVRFVREHEYARGLVYLER